MLYSISQIAKEYKYPVKTLRTRVFKSKVGKIINGITYLNEEEKEYLINPSFHKMGRKKSLKEKPLKPIKKEKPLKKPKTLKDSRVRRGQYTKVHNFGSDLKEIIQKNQDYRRYCLEAREELEKDIAILSCFSAITLFSQHRKVFTRMVLQFPHLQRDMSEIQENVFRIPLELSEACKKQQQENLIKKLSTQKEIPFSLIKFQEFLENLFLSFNFKDNLLGVFLATGRRKYEILSKGFFSIPSSESELPSLHMSGVLKKRTHHNFPRDIIFPVLYNPHKILEIIQRQREKEKVSYFVLLRYLKSQYPELGTKLHELRSLYGAYSYRLFVDDKKMNINLWLNKVLGHENEALNVSFHYSYFKESD